jgi:hypothetical protein
MYQVAYRSPLDGQVYRLRRKYSDLISAQSAADDYNVTTDCWNPIPHWAEPIEEEPSHVSNVEITISQESLII